jgi:predicted GIY-YIG superfamily endonuclease
MGLPFFVYMLRCADGSYYVGQTDDLEKRVAEHDAGGKCTFTTRRRPVTLAWSQEFPTREEAKAAEIRLKGWSRAKKEALIGSDWAGLRDAARKKDWAGHKERKAAREDPLVTRPAAATRGKR